MRCHLLKAKFEFNLNSTSIICNKSGFTSSFFKVHGNAFILSQFNWLIQTQVF